MWHGQPLRWHIMFHSCDWVESLLSRAFKSLWMYITVEKQICGAWEEIVVVNVTVKPYNWGVCEVEERFMALTFTPLHDTGKSVCFLEQLDGVVRSCDPVLVTVYIPKRFMKKALQNILSYMSQQHVYEAQVQTEEPGAEPSASVQCQIYLREREGPGRVGWGLSSVSTAVLWPTSIPLTSTVCPLC